MKLADYLCPLVFNTLPLRSGIAITPQNGDNYLMPEKCYHHRLWKAQVSRFIGTSLSTLK